MHVNNTNILNSLRNEIDKQLLGLINNDFVLLNLPYYENIGDVLIWEGELEYFKKIPYKCKFSTGINDIGYIKGNIEEGDVIIIQGGGNFGTEYRNLQLFFNDVVKAFPRNRIIIFPETVYYDNYYLLKQDAKIFSEHKDLYLCVRDNYSKNLLTRFNFCKNILLVPDMAFYINPLSLSKDLLNPEDAVLFAKRLDKEFAKNNIYNINEPPQTIIEELDWPTYYEQCAIVLEMKKILANQSSDVINSFFFNRFRLELISLGVRFLSKYKKVYTTRLHVFILCVILGIPVEVFDNTYGKNRHFFETWFGKLKSDSISYVQCGIKMRFSQWTRDFKALIKLIFHYQTKWDGMKKTNYLFGREF